jgi:hypothetical protein
MRISLTRVPDTSNHCIGPHLGRDDATKAGRKTMGIATSSYQRIHSRTLGLGSYCKASTTNISKASECTTKTHIPGRKSASSDKQSCPNNILLHKPPLPSSSMATRLHDNKAGTVISNAKQKKPLPITGCKQCNHNLHRSDR